MRLATVKTGADVVIPIHKELASELARPVEIASLWLIANSRGQQFKKITLYQAFKREMKKLGLDDKLVPHGLRKNAVVALIEAGADPRQIQSINGQSLKMIEHYGVEYNRERLARSAISMWEAAERASGGTLHDK